jgi:transposase
VLTLPTRIFLCKDPVSMHKSFEGLGAIIEQLFPGELLSGALFVFLNRQRSCLKALFWDRDGFAILYKRLERGSFINNAQNTILDRREFLMLLEGIIPQKIRPIFYLKKM